MLTHQAKSMVVPANKSIKPSVEYPENPKTINVLLPTNVTLSISIDNNDTVGNLFQLVLAITSSITSII